MAMDLYEKAGDTFFNGSRNRARAVEFYRVWSPLSTSVPVSPQGGGWGGFSPGHPKKMGRDGMILRVPEHRFAENPQIIWDWEWVPPMTNPGGVNVSWSPLGAPSQNSRHPRKGRDVRLRL